MYEVPGMNITVKAAAAFEEKYLAVKVTADGLAVATAATDNVIGFVQRAGIATEALPVMVNGITMAKASGAIAKGDAVAAAANGAVAKTTAGAYCGVALEAASAAGDIIPVLIKFGTIASVDAN